MAVLHSFASMAYNNEQPWLDSMLFQQALIQAKVPFDIVFDDNLKDLSKYRVLALPDQECLSVEQISLIRDFVKRGGGLVATGQSSLYTPWRLRRREFGLQDLLQVEAPRWAPVRAAVEQPPLPARRNQVGQGRAAYIAAVEPAVPKPPAAPATSQYWKLPRNWEDIVAAVRWAAGGTFSAEVKGPLTVTAEVLERKGGGELQVHLINFDAARTPEVKGIPVSLALPPGKQAEVSLLSPDQDKPQPLACAVKAGRAEFTVPSLKTYGVAVVQLK